MSWPLVKLTEVAEVNPRCPKDIDEDQIVSFVAMASASEAGLLLGEELRVLKDTKKGFTYFERGDVLLAKITPCFENGKTLRPYQIKNQVGFGSTEFHVVRADLEKLDPTYLFYLLWSDAFRFLGTNAMAGAAGQKRVGTPFLKQLEIPLPPLDEQKRIAAILDKADAIRQKRKQAIDLADEFLRSVFLDMFGDPVTNPKGWEVTTCGETFKLSSGKGLTAKNMDKDGNYLVYGGNGINGKHSEYMFEEPQLIIGRVGVYCGSIHITEKKSWVTDNAMYIKEYLKKVNIIFLAQLLDLANLNQYAGKAAQPLISGNRIYPLEIIFPPIEEQERFAKIHKVFIESMAKLHGGLESKSDLFQSLSQKAFSGQL
ncbi:TPA: restriction endonuclease subunit S [Vibrio vulnificus]